MATFVARNIEIEKKVFQHYNLPITCRDKGKNYFRIPTPSHPTIKLYVWCTWCDEYAVILIKKDNRFYFPKLFDNYPTVCSNWEELKTKIDWFLSLSKDDFLVEKEIHSGDESDY